MPIEWTCIQVENAHFRILYRNCCLLPKVFDAKSLMLLCRETSGQRWWMTIAMTRVEQSISCNGRTYHFSWQLITRIVHNFIFIMSITTHISVLENISPTPSSPLLSLSHLSSNWSYTDLIITIIISHPIYGGGSRRHCCFVRCNFVNMVNYDDIQFSH